LAIIGELYGDFNKFQKNWNQVRRRDGIRIIFSDILGGVGIGLMLAPLLMVLLGSWTVPFALSLATINVLFGLIFIGTGKWIFDGVKDKATLAFAYYIGTLISLVVFLLITVGFYSRLTYIVAP